MTRVMMCGLRRDSDVSLLVKAGVDAVGLITEVHQEIPCKLTREAARRFVQVIPPFTSSVLIITEESLDEIVRLVDYVNPDVLQLHGFNTLEDVAALKENLKVKIIKTLHFTGDKMAETGDPLALAKKYLDAGADAILVDSVKDNKVGSTGEVMDMELARAVRDAIYPAPLILAGGLNAGNIAAAIEKIRPYAVDVFSGVTVSGYLNANKVTEFAAAVRRVYNEPEVNYVTRR